MPRFFRPALLAATLVIASPTWAQDDTALTADSVVATVNGVDITLGHMLMIRAGLPDQYQQLPDDVLWEGILDQVIRQEVLAQGPEASETRRVQAALDNERRALLASEALAAVSEELVTEEALRAAYAANYLEAEQEEEYNASHILVETEDAAQAVIAELDAGADFAELARERSTGPSGPNGGALGWFGPGMMVPAFQDAVEALEPGTVSGPVQTQFGWHVIRLNESRVPDVPDFESVRGELESALQQDAIATYVDEAVNGAEITRMTAEGVDTSALSDLSLITE